MVQDWAEPCSSGLPHLPVASRAPCLYLPTPQLPFPLLTAALFPLSGLWLILCILSPPGPVQPPEQWLSEPAVHGGFSAFLCFVGEWRGWEGR